MKKEKKAAKIVVIDNEDDKVFIFERKSNGLWDFFYQPSKDQLVYEKGLSDEMIFFCIREYNAEPHYEVVVFYENTLFLNGEKIKIH